jgi:proliferating cell nuclear antigen
MKVVISDKIKKEIFVALFQNLKHFTSLINLTFHEKLLHIQGMDKSHVCLFDVHIQSQWFDEFEFPEKNAINLCFDTSIFYLIINTKNDSNNIIIQYTSETAKDNDNLNIHLTTTDSSKGEFNKYFKIPLADFDYQELSIPSVDYDAEFIVSSKKISDIVSQMITFGDDINIKCCEDKIGLITNGITGEMMVDISIDDINEYCMIEDDELSITYSLSYIYKMCVSNRLSNEVKFSMSNDSPMKIAYDLGNDSFVHFYIAPKVTD